MKVPVKKLFCKALVCGFLLASVGSLFPFAASCEELPDQLVRLHVVANSDSPGDQALKLQVRDAVLLEAARWYGDAQTREEATAALCLHLEAIQKAGERALAAAGSQQSLSVQVTDQRFPTREYGDFSLPAGKYRTLLVTLGAGEGKNWWCVVFPALCLPAAQDREEAFAALPDSQREVVEHPRKYRVKFKLVELYEELKRWLDQ